MHGNGCALAPFLTCDKDTIRKVFSPFGNERSFLHLFATGLVGEEGTEGERVKKRENTTEEEKER